MKEEEASAFYYWFRSGRIRAELITETGESGVRIWIVPEDVSDVRPADLWNTPRPGNKYSVQWRDARSDE